MMLMSLPNTTSFALKRIGGAIELNIKMQAENPFDNNCDSNDVVNKNYDVPAILQDAVQKVVVTEGFQTHDVDIKRVSSNGGNYMGDLYTITIKGKCYNKHKELNLFAKIISRSENTSDVVSLKSLYETETFAYTELNQMFSKLQTDANIPSKERFRMVKHYNTGNPNLILMDDMNKKDFKVFNRMEVVTLQYAKRAVKEISHFHALSFVLREKEPNFHDSKIKPQKVECNFNEDYSNFLKNVFNSAVEVLNCEEAKVKLREFSKGIMRKCQNYAEEVNVRVRVLCHGDFRVNNILYTEKNGQITNMMLLDYQQLYYGHPIKDLFYFIFGATDQTFREDHLTYLRDYYYKCFREFLLYFNMDPEDFYPKVDFEQDFKERLDYGLVVITQLLPFILAPENEAPDTKNQGISGIRVAKNNEVYKERVNDLVDEAMKWGVL